MRAACSVVVFFRHGLRQPGGREQEHSVSAGPGTKPKNAVFFSVSAQKCGPAPEAPADPKGWSGRAPHIPSAWEARAREQLSPSRPAACGGQGTDDLP